MNKRKIHAIVVRGLREAIKYHGPINKKLIGSAAKRISGVITSEISDRQNKDTEAQDEK